MKIALSELENTEENKETLIQYIADYPLSKAEKERVLGLKAKTLDHIIVKKSVSIKKLIKIVKILQKYA